MEHLLIWIMENGKNQIACFLEMYIPSMLNHLHGQTVPVSRRMRTTLTETVPF